MPWTFYNSSGEALTNFGPVALTDLDIDGGTDIGEAIVDADLFIVDNGAGGTNRKTAASRIVTYVGANAAASQAEMRTGTSNTVFATPGRTVDHSGVAKAWVYVAADGSTTELADYNCAQSDNGTGDRLFTFAVNFSSAAYVAVGSAGSPAGSELQSTIFGQNTHSASQIDCLMRQAGGSSNVDVKTHAAFFGEQVDE